MGIFFDTVEHKLGGRGAEKVPTLGGQDDAFMLGDLQAHCTDGLPHSLCLLEPFLAFASSIGVIHVGPHGNNVRDPVGVPNERVKGKAKEPRRQGVSHVEPYIDKHRLAQATHDFGDGTTRPNEGFDESAQPLRGVSHVKYGEDPRRIDKLKDLNEVSKDDRKEGIITLGGLLRKVSIEEVLCGPIVCVRLFEGAEQ